MRLNPPNFPSISAFIIIISRTTKLPPDSETNKKKWTEKKKKKKLNGWNENIHIKYKSYFYVLKLYSSWISLWLCKRIFPDNFFFYLFLFILCISFLLLFLHIMVLSHSRPNFPGHRNSFCRAHTAPRSSLFPNNHYYPHLLGLCHRFRFCFLRK